MQNFKVYPVFDIAIDRAEGSYVYDDSGQQYLDLYGGHAVISIGHSHPRYVQSIEKQLSKIGFYSNSVKMPLQEELADKLGKLSGHEDYHLFLCNSGAEANENAIKLASFETGRDKVIAFKNGFHGRTSLAVAATDNKNIQAAVNYTGNISHFELEDLEGVAAALEQRDVACVIIEGIQGIGGIVAPSSKFLQELRRLCTATETLLILDEVQSGYGRTGKFFAFQYADIQADLITVAKGMGNGFPIGGVLISPKFEAQFGQLGTTFGGSHLACAAGIAVLDVIKEEALMDNCVTIGNYLKEAFQDIAYIQEVRGEGLLLGLVFDRPVKELRAAILNKHFIFTGSSTDPNVLRLLPPMGIGKKEADAFVLALKTSLDELMS